MSTKKNVKARGDGTWCTNGTQDVSPHFTGMHPRLTMTQPRTETGKARILARIWSPHQEPLHSGTHDPPRSTLPCPLCSDCASPRPACAGPYLQVTEEQGAPVGVGQPHHGVPVDAAVAVPPSCKEATPITSTFLAVMEGALGPGGHVPSLGHSFYLLWVTGLLYLLFRAVKIIRSENRLRRLDKSRTKHVSFLI